MVRSERPASALSTQQAAFLRLGMLWQQRERKNPPQWGKDNRVYPPSAGVPGPRDPGLTPYIIAFEKFFDNPRFEVCALISGTQMSKTDGILDVMGWRLATKPRPQLYVGPSKDFVSNQFEPRLMKLFDEAVALAPLVARGKRNKKTLKTVAGVTVRLAWAGSATSLASDQAGDVYVDEFDKMVGGVKGEGGPFGLAKARADTYRDRKIAVTSTPKRGAVETEKDETTGLEFWKMADPADIESPIWAKWQTGTRHHFAWRCPHCEKWFIPRMSLLRYPKDATPSEARANTWLECPNNGCVIEETHKSAMNAYSLEHGGPFDGFVAPGMAIGEDGTFVEADMPDNSMLSLWVSGLASPFLSWGERVEEVLNAELSGDAEERQGATNKTGELWSPTATGDVPTWQVIKNQAEPYAEGTMPGAAIHPVITVDVQRDRLVYVIRGWGARASSWLIERGYLFGDTSQIGVWDDLAEKVSAPIDGVPLKLGFIDSGFRPGKPITLPLNRVYAFCRRFRRFVYPTKGSSRPMLRPLVKVKPDVNRQADVAKYGLELIRLDTDHWKSFVHERLSWPLDQLGAFHLHQDIDEDYCRQLVAEVRVVTDSGKPQWVVKSTNNHFLDCEAMNAAAAYMLNVHHIRPGTTRRRMEEGEAGPAMVVPETPAAAVAAKDPRFSRFANMAARLNR